MLSYKTYIKTLFVALATIILSAILYSYYFTKHYPLAITNRISLDAKITFIKEHIDLKNIDTIIVGSSIGLNNVQGEILESSSSKVKGVLNLSVYEATSTQIEQILELIDIFPNLDRVIYSAQYSDFAYAGKLKDYNSTFIKSYLGDDLALTQKVSFYFDALKNIFFSIRREWNWNTKYMQSNQFTYLGFDKTGSVPLHIYGKDIIKSKMWKIHMELDKIQKHLKH